MYRGVVTNFTIFIILCYAPLPLLARSSPFRISQAPQSSYHEKQLNEAKQLHRNANQLFRFGQNNKAIPLAERALKIREEVLGTMHLETASSMSTLALLYQLTGRYKNAEALYKKVLAIYIEKLGNKHPRTIRTQLNLAKVYQRQGHYRKADPHFKQGITTSHKRLGLKLPSPSPVINFNPSKKTNKNSLTLLQRKALNDAYRKNDEMQRYIDEGQYNLAINLTENNLATLEKNLGSGFIETAEVQSNLATLYHKVDRLTDAEQLFKSSLSIKNRLLDPNDTSKATTLNNFAALYKSMGRYKNSELYYKQAIAIFKNKFGNEHSSTTTSINNLAELYLEADRLNDAERLFKHVLSVEERLYRDHNMISLSLNNLANTYKSMRRYREAEVLLRRSLNLRIKNLRSGHPDIANSYNNLAEIYRAKGSFNEAEELYNKSLLIFKEAFGENHPTTVTSLQNLFLLQLSQKKYQPAFNNLKQSITFQDNILKRNIVNGSDKDKRKYLFTIASTMNAIVSLYFTDFPYSEEGAKLSLSTITQRKGRILDLYTNLRENLLKDPHSESIFSDLSDVYNQLTSLEFNKSKNKFFRKNNATMISLRSRIDRLEDELNRRSKEYSELTTSLTPKDIQDILPTKTALVEFVRYQPFRAGEEKVNRFSSAHYAVFILHKNGDINGINLGPANEIDQIIKQFSQSLASPDTPRFQVKEEARKLDAQIMAPVRKALGNIKTIFLSPDSALNLIPFEALVDESGKFLVTQYQFRYLTSGRDLLRLTNRQASGNQVVLMGDPTFSRGEEVVAQQRSFSLEENRFPLLSGTKDEVEAIAQQFRGAQVYLNAGATEAQLKAVKQPRILHIATHGFFSRNEGSVNPLLNSGLVLAGVKNRQSGPKQDGILSALEVTGLNLSGTQLAVLSACQTGLGNLVDGEGVYGLRRALVLAGTQSQVISLWKVDDQATKELMVAYYNRLLAGDSRDVALRETQQSFLEHPEYNHPYYWASFIASGDWKPLTPK